MRVRPFSQPHLNPFFLFRRAFVTTVTMPMCRYYFYESFVFVVGSLPGISHILFFVWLRTGGKGPWEFVLNDRTTDRNVVIGGSWL